MSEEDKKPVIEEPKKSSMEILSELFSTFDAEPPVIVKKEKSDEKAKKAKKKKHKQKDKKHKHKEKKKSKKRKRSSESNSSDDDKKINLADLLIKKEPDEKKITIAGTELKTDLPVEKPLKKSKMEPGEIKSDEETKKKKHRCHRHEEKHDRRNRSRERHKDERPGRDRSRHNPFYNPPRDRSRKNRSRSNTREHRRSPGFDKKKLLEIARKNALLMMKSGNLPSHLNLGAHAQEKVLAAIQAGGKTVEELTDFCKTLSHKETNGDRLSSPERNSDSDADKPFHHPFQIKDRPTTITMNIKNSIPLPLKSTQERTSELRLQFPVSSGQQHRRNEHEWVPVEPKKPPKAEPVKKVEVKAIPLPDVVPVVEQAEPPPPPDAPDAPNVDISSIVSQRLSAMRRLQENPFDITALSEMNQINQQTQSWVQSKQQFGQFTGSTGANVMSHSQLSSGYQAWAKKNQLQTAAPVTGGMGMHLLQKMGWRPGEGLGKEKSGALEPLLLEVKLDKKGLVATEEARRKKPKAAQAQALPTGKHPVSMLGEHATKNKIPPPTYECCFECGPDHKKNFLFKVILNNVEYKPNVASKSKKEAKAVAAKLCLEQLGVLPT